MKPISVGELLPGAKPFKDGNRNAVYHGNISIAGYEKKAFIKLLNPNKLFIECVCSTLGRELGLPIPEPFILKINDDDSVLPNTAVGSFLFGADDGKHPSFRRFVTKQDGSTDVNQTLILTQKLSKWKKLIDGALLDEHIVNEDRHFGNLLYDGGDDFILIDHDIALSPSHNVINEIKRNVLFGLVQGLDDVTKKRHQKHINTAILPKLGMINVDELIDSTRHEVYSPNIRAVEFVRQFLNNRLRYISLISNTKLGYPPASKTLNI